MQRKTDRRKYQRFTVNGGVLAVLEPFPIKMGRVMDISEGGLEIRYFQEEAWPEDLSALSILMADDRTVRLENIPVSTIEDLEVVNGQACLVERRRRSLQFGNLSEEQRRQLGEFIRAYTDCATPDRHEIAS